MAELKCPEGSSCLRDAPRSQCSGLALSVGEVRHWPHWDSGGVGVWWGNSNPRRLIDSSRRPRVHGVTNLRKEGPRV